MIITNTKRICKSAVFGLSLIFVSAGCQSLLSKTIKPPDLRVTGSTGVKVDAKGNATQPGTIASSKTESVIAVPAGSTVSTLAATVTEPAKTVVTLSAATELKSVTVSDSITTPKGSTAPTANELATAQGITWSYWAAGVLFLFAIGLVYFQHTKAAGFAFAGSVLAVPLARFVSSDKALLILGCFVAVACALWYAWYAAEKKLKPAKEVQE